MMSSGVEPGTYPNVDGRWSDLDSREVPAPPRAQSIRGLVVAAIAALAVNGLALWLIAGVAPLILPAAERERVMGVFLLHEPGQDPGSAIPPTAEAPAPTARVEEPAPATPSPTLPIPDQPRPQAVLPEPLPSPPASAPAARLSPVGPQSGSNARSVTEGIPASPAFAQAADPLADRSPAPPPEPPVRRPAERTPVKLPADWAGNRKPEYPRMAYRLGEQGEVRVSVLVDAQGQAVEVKITQSSGSTRLDQSAIEAARQWRFTPATEDGKPVPDWYHDWRWEFRIQP